MSAWDQPAAGLYRRSWDSVEEWRAAGPSKANANHGSARHGRGSEAGDRSGGWYGETTAGDALAIALGQARWTAGRAAYQSAAEAIAGSLPRAASIRRRRSWGDDGDELCPDRLRAGALDVAWSRTVREARMTPGGAHVAVVIQAAASASVEGDAYRWAGAASVALVDALETAGYSVALWRVAALDDRSHKSAAFLPLKRASEPLDVDRLLTLTAHPGVYRTQGFRADYCSAPVRCSAGLGCPIPWTSLSAALQGDLGRVIVGPDVNGMSRGGAQAAVAWLKATIAGINDGTEAVA